MGMIAAPPYACLTIGFLEEEKLFPRILPQYFNRSQCDYLQLYFKRYMDDGFLPLSKSILIDTLISCFNQLHPSLKFTYEEAKITSNETGHI